MTQTYITPGPLNWRHFILISELNSYKERETDCSRTFDYMMKSKEKIINSLENLSNLQIFEIALRLDKRGINNLWEIFRYNIIEKGNVWEKRQLIEDIRFIHERNGK